MGLVKRLKCEKKLHVDDFIDKNYATSNDSESFSSSCVDNPQTKDRRRNTKRRNKHRRYQFFRLNKPDDTLWEDIVKNRRNSMNMVSENRFASFLNKRAGIYNDNRSQTKSLSIETTESDWSAQKKSKTCFYPGNTAGDCYENNTINSERYWENEILPKFSADQRDLLAESLFSHIWHTQGESVASKLLNNFDSTNLDYKSNDCFDNGCQLWAENNTERAYREFERSRRIREVQATQKSLLHVQCLQDDKQNNQIAEENAEFNAELYYSLGMAQSAKENLYASQREFRRAMQIGALGLGIDHEITKASLYMIRSTSLEMGQTEHEIQQSLSLLTSDVEHEIDADKLYALGKKEEALLEYANLSLLYDSDSMVQARIITKMATIFEEKRDYSKALDLWTDLLVLYNETPSLGLHHPLARHALAKVVGARKRTQPWSEI